MSTAKKIGLALAQAAKEMMPIVETRLLTGAELHDIHEAFVYEINDVFKKQSLGPMIACVIFQETAKLLRDYLHSNGIEVPQEEEMREI